MTARDLAGYRVVAVHAHPDDESSKGAATMAKYVAEGVQVMVATCTGGERGSVLNPAMDRPEVVENLAEVRRAELDAAAKLGIATVQLIREQQAPSQHPRAENFYQIEVQ